MEPGFMCVMILIVFIIVLIVLEMKPEKFEEIKDVDPIPDFSVSEYLNRIEKYSLQLISERESKKDSEEYIIILWWGLDGIRLNKDGTIKPVQKNPLVFTEVPVSNNSYWYPPVQIGQSPLGYTSFPNVSIMNQQIQQCCSTRQFIDESMCQCTQNRLLELQEQNTRLSLQLAQSQQNQLIIQGLQNYYDNF